MTPTPPFRVFTTLDFDVLRVRRRWPGGLEVDSLETRGLDRRSHVLRVLRAAGQCDALLLNGSGRYDQLAAAALGLRRARIPIVIADSTWKRGDGPTERLIKRVGLRAVDSPRVTYCVLSSAERQLFARTWGVDPARVEFTPFHYTLREDDLAEPLPEGKGVFAGGESMRDYAPLLSAASALDAQVVVAASEGSLGGGHPPPNVKVGRVPPALFVELLRSSAVVVVPLRPGIERSAGQQTYLNAMALGKFVIATDSPGVRDHVQDEETGLIVPPGDAAALGSAIGWALDPTNATRVQEIRARGRDVARNRFTPARYVERLVRVVGVALRGRGGSPRPAGA